MRLTGKTDALVSSWRGGSYFPIDGGGGAHLFSELDLLGLPRAYSPRHATAVIVAAPVSDRFAAAVLQVIRAVPKPHRVIVAADDREAMRLPEVLSSARRVNASAQDVIAALKEVPAELAYDAPSVEPVFVQTTPKAEREIATELAVISLGPMQPFSAGPLQLLLVCDGEQIDSVRVERGWAARGLEASFLSSSWQECMSLAEAIDPLAPAAGRIVFETALDLLRDRIPSEELGRRRAAELARERAMNHLWWTSRFLRLLGLDSLATRAGRIALLTRGSAAASAAADLRDVLARDRMIRLRTRGVGVLTEADVLEGGLSGPVAAAARRGSSDAHDRLLERITAAVVDLQQSDVDGNRATDAAESTSHGEVSAGVEGPRGTLTLRLRSEGGSTPAAVEWTRPSACLIGVLPKLLERTKLADAEVTIASLDISAAEADG